MNASEKFLKKYIALEKSISTGSVLLDRAFKIPLRTFLLLQGEANCGTTAVALQLASELLKQGQIVIFYDTNLSLEGRTTDTDDLLIVRPNISLDELVETISLINNYKKDITLILDGLHFIERKLEQEHRSVPEIIRKLREMYPNVTVIGTSRKKSIDSIWSNVVKLDKDENRYIEIEGSNLLLGHFINIKGPLGRSKVFINSGKVSMAYESASLEIEVGKTPASTFDYKSIKVKGIWQLVYQAGEINE